LCPEKIKREKPIISLADNRTFGYLGVMKSPFQRWLAGSWLAASVALPATAGSVPEVAPSPVPPTFHRLSHSIIRFRLPERAAPAALAD
jgi:hypothetical protein